MDHHRCSDVDLYVSRRSRYYRSTASRYDISPGTLYPLLRRMESHGWLELLNASTANIHSRKEYRLTKLGAEALDLIRAQLRELCREVLEENKAVGRRRSERRPPGSH